MSIKTLSRADKSTAWKVLDMMQNEIPLNQSLDLKKVLDRFELIQELKDQIDVRKTEEKLPAESILFDSQAEIKNPMQSMQQYKNNLCALLYKRQSATKTIAR